MATKWTAGLVCLLMVAGLAAGCGKDDHGDDKKHGEEGSVVVPSHYPEAVARCEELSQEIGKLIDDGKLDKVHKAANAIKKIAEKLPEIAQKQLPVGMLKDVNIKSKELAGMFAAIDKAADSGDKAETTKLHEKMKTLIAGLKAHAGHAKKPGGDD